MLNTAIFSDLCRPIMTGNGTTSIRLDELPQEQWAQVVGLTVPTHPADQELVLRLVELGFVPGERVRLVAGGAPAGGPLAVRVGHTTFALRPHEASFILVRIEP